MWTWFNPPSKQFIQYQTDATRKAAEIIEKSKVGIWDESYYIKP